MNDALNKQTRRALLTAVLAVLLCSLVFAVTAQPVAPAGINFTLDVNPNSLTAPGNVKISARVANAGTEDMNTPFSLYDPDGKLITTFGDGGSLLRLPSGDTYLWEGEYMVSQAQLEEGNLVYTLRFSTQDASGALVEQNLPANASILFSGEKVDLKITRTITPEVVRRGKEVVVLYELVNQGNVRLTNIQITENRLISTRAQSVASLEPGASAKITFTKTNATADLTSSALVTYRKEGDRTNQRQNITAMQIPLAKPALTYTLTADKTQVSIGEPVTLTLEIKNNGNISYSNVSVTDPKLGEVFSNVQIDVGQTKELKREVTVNETSTYAFTLHLQDNTGTTQEEKVPETKVSAYTEGQMLRLNLTLTSDSETIDSMPGAMRFHLTVTNDSNTAAKNIRIMHGSEEIYTITELAPGQNTVVTRDYMLSQAGKYQFTAIATDVQNNPMEFTSNPLTISYVAPTPAPTREVVATIAPVITHSPVPADYAPQGGQAKNALFILTLAVGALAGLSVVLLAVSGAMRARARAKSKAAYDTFEISATRDYTSPPDESRKAVETLQTTAESNAEATAEKAAQGFEMPHEKYLKADPVPKMQGTDKIADEPAVASNGEATPLTSDEDGAFRLVREDTAEDADETPADDEAGDGSRSRRSRRHQDSETEE